MIDSSSFSHRESAATVTTGSSLIADSLDQILSTVLKGSLELSPWRRELPWSIVRGDDAIELRLTELREETLADSANRELFMLCGAVAENVRLAASEGGFALVMDSVLDEDTGIVAKLRIDPSLVPSHEDSELLRATAPASTGHRQPKAGARGTLLSPALLALLRHAARSGGGWLEFVVDDARREMLADLELEASTIADAERGARRLMAVRGIAASPGRARFLVGGRARLAEMLSPLGGKVTVRHDCTSGRAGRIRAAVAEAPLLAVVGTQGDSPRDWLAAGRALQRVLLHASLQGLWVTFLNEPIDNTLVRDALRSVLFADGVPHAVLRFDYEQLSET